MKSQKLKSDDVTVCVSESQDSGYLYFCFRWLLIRFKRELSFQDVLRLWEVSQTSCLVCKQCLDGWLPGDRPDVTVVLR